MGAKWAKTLAVLAAIAILGWARAPAAPTEAGLVEEVSGSATAAGETGKRTLAAHDGVYVGDDVATGALSRARLALGRDTIVRLGENTDLRIDKYLLDAGGVLTIGAGAVLIDKTPSKGPVRLRGAFGLITVRGTQVFAGPSKGVIGVFVVHGVIDLTSGGATVTLRDGEGSDVARPGARPTKPHAWGAARIQAALASVQ